MRKMVPLLAAAALLAGAAPLAAQQGFALKGHYVFNESNVDDAREEDRVPSADGFSIGAEYVLPMGIGVGVSAYTEGEATGFDAKTTSFFVLAEANYFFDLPIIPITPYAGVHAGLGQYTIDTLDDGEPRIEDDRTQLGFQLGARWQVTRTFGIDAQFRRVSDSASESQSPDLERNQFMLGVTVF
jgi:Outer membrane protein beta-barrel domain